MNRIHNAKYDETYYEEILDNGLDVIVWHKPSYTTSYCIFATPYGSLDLDQIDEKGKIIHFPAGIAGCTAQTFYLGLHRQTDGQGNVRPYARLLQGQSCQGTAGRPAGNGQLDYVQPTDYGC